MNEHEKILALLDKAVAKTRHLTEPEPLIQAHDEMWVAARWITRLDDPPGMMTEIFEDEERAYFFACFLVLALSKVEKQIEEIEEGISWESEGMTFVASRLD